MKIESISIQNFKLFDNLTVSFRNKTLDEVNDRFLVLGDNGTGKTTLLQAIAMPLAVAMHQIRDISEFDWIGFLPGRYMRWGAPHIELEISFEDEEIDATQEVADRWFRSQPEASSVKTRGFISPARDRVTRITMDGESCRAESHAQYFQFHGRAYAQRLLKTDPAIRRFFSKLPGLFWFDQFRNLGSTPLPVEANGTRPAEMGRRVAYEVGVARLRRYLNGWALERLSISERYQNDYLLQLENLYKRVFPGRSFAGVEPMPDVDSPTAEDFYFLLNDGHRTYDIVEMSAGEQAVFPLLYEFVRQQVAYSIVLIDEIDLNLHPPAAQLLVSQLPKIGPTCQFIFTSHSEAVSSIIGTEEIYRLPGGSLCL